MDLVPILVLNGRIHLIAPLIVEFETSQKLDQRDNWFVLRNGVMNVLNHNVKRG